MGKTRDLFRKIRDIKGKFLARMVMIKNRNCRDLIEAERLRRGGKNTQRNCAQTGNSQNGRKYLPMKQLTRD